MIGEVFYRVGELIGGIETRTHAGDWQEEPEPGAPPRDATVARDAALSAAGAWLVARLLRPKPVRWPRVIAAGVAGTLLADLVGRMQDDAPGRRSPPFAENPAELLGRLAAGIAVAAGYAALLYPRLPGSPLLRGLAFGALEIAAAPRGGLVRLAAEAPGVRFPLQALALPVDEDASPAAHMAFGAALGMLYRNGVEAPPVEDVDDDDYDEDYDDD